MSKQHGGGGGGGGKGDKPYSRREISRLKAQERRVAYKTIMDDLTQVLPFPKDVVAQLDYNSRLRLALCFFRLKTLMHPIKSESAVSSSSSSDPSSVSSSSSAATTSTDAGGSSSVSGSGSVAVARQDRLRQRVYEPGMLHNMMAEALDGFLMVASSEGNVIYLSESVHHHLGIFQSEHIGISIYDMISEDDHKEVRTAISKAEARANTFTYNRKSAEVMFFCRMKCSRFKIANTVTKSPGFKLVYVSGTIKMMGSTEYFLVTVVRPVSPPSILEIRMEANMFVTHYDLDMKCLFFDGRLKHFIGYSKTDLEGKVPYGLHHHADTAATMKCSVGVMGRGEGLSGYYRFLTQSGVYVWLQTRATLMHDSRTGKPTYIVCMNYIISKEEGEKDLKLREAITSGSSKTGIQEGPSHSFDPFPVTYSEDGTIENPLPMATTQEPTFQSTSWGHKTDLDTDELLLANGVKKEVVFPEISCMSTLSSSKSPDIDIQELPDSNSPENLISSQPVCMSSTSTGSSGLGSRESSSNSTSASSSPATRRLQPRPVSPEVPCIPDSTSDLGSSTANDASPLSAATEATPTPPDVSMSSDQGYGSLSRSSIPRSMDHTHQPHPQSDPTHLPHSQTSAQQHPVAASTATVTSSPPLKLRQMLTQQNPTTSCTQSSANPVTSCPQGNIAMSGAVPSQQDTNPVPNQQYAQSQGMQQYLPSMPNQNVMLPNQQGQNTIPGAMPNQQYSQVQQNTMPGVVPNQQYPQGQQNTIPGGMPNQQYPQAQQNTMPGAMPNQQYPQGQQNTMPGAMPNQQYPQGQQNVMPGGMPNQQYPQGQQNAMPGAMPNQQYSQGQQNAMPGAMPNQQYPQGQQNAMPGAMPNQQYSHGQQNAMPGAMPNQQYPQGQQNTMPGAMPNQQYPQGQQNAMPGAMPNQQYPQGKQNVMPAMPNQQYPQGQQNVMPAMPNQQYPQGQQNVMPGGMPNQQSPGLLNQQYLNNSQLHTSNSGGVASTITINTSHHQQFLNGSGDAMATHNTSAGMAPQQNMLGAMNQAHHQINSYPLDQQHLVSQGQSTMLNQQCQTTPQASMLNQQYQSGVVTTMPYQSGNMMGPQAMQFQNRGVVQSGGVAPQGMQSRNGAMLSQQNPSQLQNSTALGNSLPKWVQEEPNATKGCGQQGAWHAPLPQLTGEDLQVLDLVDTLSGVRGGSVGGAVNYGAVGVSMGQPLQQLPSGQQCLASGTICFTAPPGTNSMSTM